MTLRETDLPPVRLPDASRELGLLVEAREDLVAEATRVRNRVHADLVVLVPGRPTSSPRVIAARPPGCSGAGPASRPSSPETASAGSPA